MKKSKLVYGVGVNDTGYQVYITAVVCGKQKKIWVCPFYEAWTGMLARCYSPKVHAGRPTYAGCSIATEWLRLSVFSEWMAGQDWKENHLDKDILIFGNKFYGPETCVFVSRKLNNFLTDRAAARGNWPIGVYWNKQSGKFRSLCSNPFTGKQEYLGYYGCPNEAHEVWRARKHEHACRYADMQTDPRIAEALRKRYAKGEQA